MKHTTQHYASDKSVLQVVAAVLYRWTSGPEILAFKRNRDDVGGNLFEFPGGKIDLGEQAAEALHREIFEELGIRGEILQALPVSHFQYPSREIAIQLFIFKPESWDIHLTEHESMVWLGEDQASNWKWIEADLPLLPLVFDLLRQKP
jgi:8-oxo-dGTP diphosphatase